MFVRGWNDAQAREAARETPLQTVGLVREVAHHRQDGEEAFDGIACAQPSAQTRADRSA